MNHSDFTLGMEFMCGGRRWRCTDVGTRVIVAIVLDVSESRLRGPPYSVTETVFDEYDLPGCTVIPS